jgi:hypothetical protein
MAAVSLLRLSDDVAGWLGDCSTTQPYEHLCFPVLHVAGSAARDGRSSLWLCGRFVCRLVPSDNVAGWETARPIAHRPWPSSPTPFPHNTSHTSSMFFPSMITPTTSQVKPPMPHAHARNPQTQPQHSQTNRCVPPTALKNLQHPPPMLPLTDGLDYITIRTGSISNILNNNNNSSCTDKASCILGIKHRRSMEPIPASAQTSIVATHSACNLPSMPFTTSLSLTSLYVVSGLPKSPHTRTLADPDSDSVMHLHYSDGAVSRW